MAGSSVGVWQRGGVVGVWQGARCRGLTLASSDSLSISSSELVGYVEGDNTMTAVEVNAGSRS